MTEPREVTVSDEQAAYHCIEMLLPCTAENLLNAKQALAAFLARRVPDAMDEQVWITKHVARGLPENIGHNACRDKVLKGV